MAGLKSLLVFASVLAVLGASGQPAPAGPAVRVWTGSLDLPVYAEGPANPNPPFDLFSFGRFNYPYPIRDALTDRPESVSLRTLHLENEYLRLTVLPDFGGHVYSCLDKRSGREMFYANTAIKKALIGYRGAWAAFGIEFNFPVSHNWVSLSPVDFAAAQHADGSASVWVGNVDRVYGSQWRVELRLAPGRTVLEQHVELHNPTDARHRYYWWSNAAVQVWEDSQMVYPTELMATHGFTRIEPWPIDARGRDLSIIRNQTDGPVSLFTHATREPFVGVYHPHTSSGTVHVADPAELPTHKFWSWGNDRDALSWRKALSDDESGYVELQAGLFRNQETYAMLEPQETVRFSEYWLPVRDLGGITRANVDAVLHLQRTTPTRLRIAVDVTRGIPGARVRITGAGAGRETSEMLSPVEVWRTEMDAGTTTPVTVEIADPGGRIVLRHTENVFDRMPASAARLGPQSDPRLSDRAAGPAGVVESGLTDELEGRRLAAMSRYRAALEQHPGSFPLLKAAGRLAVALGWADAKTGDAARAIGWLESAYARNTTDFEVQYYYGLALAAAGRPQDARRLFEASRRFRATRAAAALQLALLSAREGDPAASLRQLAALRAESPRASHAGALEVAMLRRLQRDREAGDRAQYWQAVDPTSSLLRFEMTLLGRADPALWPHLGAEANRVLDLVDQYLSIGGYADALALLERQYPRVEPPAREPGAVGPQDSPLVAYYRGYVRERLGVDAAADYQLARSLSTAYVFPNRRSSYAVLEAALRSNPEDATARFLLGSLYLASARTQPAVDAWQRVRRARPAIPTLHRSLGLALLQSGDARGARAVLEEGTEADNGNVEVYLALDGVLSAANAAPRERVTALRRYPASPAMPASIVFKLAVALAEAGDAVAAEGLFHDRFFPSEEGGTSVRAVYAQVRLTSASAAAQRRDCAAALGILDALPRERPGLPFTAGGLEGAIAPPALARQAATVESRCGRRAAARARWVRLARALDADSGPMPLAMAETARRQIGTPRTPAQRQRLEHALEAATRSLDSGATNNPGMTEYIRASLLDALGRTEESRGSLRRVFLFPDRNLSHALARADLRVAPAAGGR